MGIAASKHPTSSVKRSPQLHGWQSGDDEVDELSPDQHRSRSRKSKQLLMPVDLEVDGEDAAQQSDEEAEEIDDGEAATILTRARGNGRQSVRALESPDLDEPTPVPAKKKGRKTRKVSTPAQQRQPKPAAPKAAPKPVAKSAKQSNKSSKVRVGSPIPIIVHRFTQRPQYDDDDSDADILNSEIPYIKRAGVNPIDVLSQVCREIIDSGLETLAEGGRQSEDPVLRREYKTKFSAVEAFGREMQNRLLGHVGVPYP